MPKYQCNDCGTIEHYSNDPEGQMITRNWRTVARVGVGRVDICPKCAVYYNALKKQEEEIREKHKRLADEEIKVLREEFEKNNNKRIAKIKSEPF